MLICTFYLYMGGVERVTIKVNKVQFTSIAEFKTWNEEEEIKLHANFVQECASQSSSIKQTWYYYCNRSGIYRETGKGIRNTKRQGSSKTGQRCTAHMNGFTHNVYSNAIEIQWLSFSC